tara:strand:- start:122 stop:565 length:444 start_codon:yes stop_codon:yes gene_type:complete
MDKIKKYVLDDDTQELLETVMNWAQTVVDLQQDEEMKEDMQMELEILADRFNITRSSIDIEEIEEADGSTTLKIKLGAESNETGAPKLTLVSATSPGANVVILDKLKPVTHTTRNLTLVDNPSANDTEFHDLMDESLTTDDTDPTSP